ncbi:hypothetical protein CLOBOL_02958 [Enterocloster bolteae ATCC BAA-613]|uniref:Uncharacterized protein n=1 Tax=Enterocloster bolteae (strain ATCC BAA-613 / DSM 15670 / CCUG 46953 / JCM 12243 / WAL 16351) TaxID=411902 RepID=A8RRA2_ENTBW|nr:hypothetical protein CLOBOL_02958 [Enterocloster bolteae ATCC BAA-613]
MCHDSPSFCLFQPSIKNAGLIIYAGFFQNIPVGSHIIPLKS